MIRTLIFVVVVLAVVVLLLGFLSGEALSDWGSQAAEVTLKGARGGSVFVESFKKRLERGQEGEEAAPAEEDLR